MKPWVIVVGVYLAVTVGMALPFVELRQLDTATFAGDGRLIVWTIAWTNHALLNGHSLFAANMFFPAPNALAYSEHMIGLGLLALPLNALTGNPVLIFSILWLAGFWTNAIAAHLLAFRFTSRHDASLVAGLVFAWTYFRMSHAGHLHLQWTAWLPLSMWFLDRWVRRTSWSDSVGATATTLMQMLTSWYLAVLTMFANVGWLVWLLAIARPPQFGRLAGQAGAGALVGAVVLFPLAVPYVRVLGARPDTVLSENSADLSSYLKAPEDTWMGQVLETRFAIDGRWIWGEQTLFLGWTALALALLGGGVVVARVVAARGDLRRQHAIPLFFVALASVGLWLSLGPNAPFLPFSFFSVVPGLSLFRAPARFALLVVLGVAVLGAIGFGWCLERVGTRRTSGVLVACIGLVMLAEWRVVTPVLRAVDEPIPAIYKVLNVVPAGAVVSLPDYRLRAEWFNRADYLLYATSHWRPIVNGYGRSEPPEYFSIVEQLSTFPSQDAAELARALGVRYFVIHTQRLGTRDPIDAALRGRDFRQVGIAGTDYLFEVVAKP